LIVITIAGLVTDAIVHFNLASAFASNKTSVLSEADIFRIDASVAVVAAVALAVRPRRYTAAFAFLVAAAGTAAVIVYRYVDIGAFGPIPNMYDPYWQPIGKVLSVIGEAIATVTALSLFVMLHRRAGSPTHDAVTGGPSAARVSG
jgi:hypothetical protein